MMFHLYKSIKRNSLLLSLTKNSNLTGHIKVVDNKINTPSVIFRIRRKLNSDTSLMLCLTLIQPCLEYCNIVWASDRSIYFDVLFLIKKDYPCHNLGTLECSYFSIFKSLNILTIFKLNKFQILCFAFMTLNQLLSKQFAIFLMSNYNIPS